MRAHLSLIAPKLTVPPILPPTHRSESKDFKTIEAEKDARTPSQADWLSRAGKIPVKQL